MLAMIQNLISQKVHHLMNQDVQNLLLALFLFVCGFFIIFGVMLLVTKSGRKKVKNGVRGELTVVSITVPSPSPGATTSSFILKGVITAPGIAATPVQKRGIISHSKWPQRGQVMPVSVEATDPSIFSILWDQIRGAEDGEVLAQKLADKMNAGTAATPETYPGYSTPFALPAQVGVTSFGSAVEASIVAALSGSRTPGIATVQTVSEEQSGMFSIIVRVRPETPGVAEFTTVMNIGLDSQAAARKQIFTTVGSQFPVLFAPSMPQLTMPDMKRVPQSY